MQAFSAENLHIFIEYLKPPEFRKIRRDIGCKLTQSIGYELRIERGLLR